MTLEHRIRSLAEALPAEGASVILSKRDLLDMLAADEPVDGSENRLMDLDVTELMAATGRARSTVLGWIKSGELQAYKFRREWRITEEAWRRFRDGHKDGTSLKRSTGTDPRRLVADLGSWRTLSAQGRS